MGIGRKDEFRKHAVRIALTSGLSRHHAFAERGGTTCLCRQVAHGFEFVQSVCPGWKFNAASSAASFGLHGAVVIGPWNDLKRYFQSEKD